MGLQTKTGIAAELDANLEDLPTPPWVAIEVIRLSNDDNSTIRQLADVLGQDPVMAARLLKLANSPFYSRGGEITSLERAASLLGQKTVKLMALSFSLTAVSSFLMSSMSLLAPRPDGRMSCRRWFSSPAAWPLRCRARPGCSPP